MRPKPAAMSSAIRFVPLVLLFGWILPLFGRDGWSQADSPSAPVRQVMTPFPTPTPRADGYIGYIVQEGDSPWRIAAIAGITVEELFALNGILPGDYITPGMELILGSAGPPAPTAGPETPLETPTAAAVTPTPASGTGQICVLLFQDVNGNARLDDGEAPLTGGQVSVADAAGLVSVEQTTDESPEGYCFAELPGGDYNVSAAVPAGYNPTTGMNLPVRLRPGDIKYVEFGAQPSGVIGGGLDQGDGRSPVLGILGAVLLIAAGGLGYYATRAGRR